MPEIVTLEPGRPDAGVKLVMEGPGAVSFSSSPHENVIVARTTTEITDESLNALKKVITLDLDKLQEATKMPMTTGRNGLILWPVRFVEGLLELDPGTQVTQSWSWSG